MSTAQPTARRGRSTDEGFTLVELIVSGALLSIAILVVGSMMMSLFSTERTVSGLTQGADQAQLTATSIDERVSQASSFSLTDVGDDQFLVARVAGRGDDLSWECFAWYYSAADGGSIRYTVAPDGTAMTIPTSSQLATWPTLIEGVAAPDGDPVFEIAGPRLTIAFDADAGNAAPVAIRLTSVRLEGVTEEETCS